MYQYDEYDQALVSERVAQFRDQIARRLDGELSKEEFLPLRLQNGLYLQKRAYVLRVATPYDTLSSPQSHALAHVAYYYDRGYGHSTMRQNIQFDWIELGQVGDILKHLVGVQMHAIQTSGNCVRNITTEIFAGVAADEWTDPRSLAEILCQWPTVSSEFLFLPRKFKIILSSAVEDRTAVQMHDIGLYLYRHPDAGELHLRVLVSGGPGCTSMLGQVIRDDLPWQHLLSYVEATPWVYNRYGRRDNEHKVWIKIPVKVLGIEVFTHKVEEEQQYLRNGPAQLTAKECQRVAERFVLPRYLLPVDDELTYGSACAVNLVFACWTSRNVQAHKVPGYISAALSTKPGASAPLDNVIVEQMECVADWAGRYGFDEIRVAHGQNLVFPDVRLENLHTLWREVCAADLGTPNQDPLSDVIACPGGDYCVLANAKLIPITQGIQQRFEDLDHLHDTGELSLDISGCMSARDHHHVGNTGILGADKNDGEWYQVTLGGVQGKDSALGKVIEPSFSAVEVPTVIERIVETFTDLRVGPERFTDTFNRAGLEPFKTWVYARVEELA